MKSLFSLLATLALLFVFSPSSFAFLDHGYSGDYSSSWEPPQWIMTALLSILAMFGFWLFCIICRAIYRRRHSPYHFPAPLSARLADNPNIAWEQWSAFLKTLGFVPELVSATHLVFVPGAKSRVSAKFFCHDGKKRKGQLVKGSNVWVFEWRDKSKEQDYAENVLAANGLRFELNHPQVIRYYGWNEAVFEVPEDKKRKARPVSVPLQRPTSPANA